MVFIHGLGLSGESFRGAFDHPALADYGLVVPDMVGFGNSPPPPLGFDFELASQAAALWQVLDTWGIKDVTLVGHSMGGTVAVCMAVQRPHAVKCLIVAEGNLTREPSAWSAQIVAAGLEGFEPEFYKLAETESFGALNHTTPQTVWRSAFSLQETPERLNFRDFLSQKRLPVYFLRGDQPVSEVNSLALCDELDIPVRTVSGCGHFFTQDNPDEFYRLIAETAAIEDLKAEAARKLVDKRLTLLNQLSRSGIATVWEAYDGELDRKVLVKYINPQYSRDDEIRARFQREARAIAKLSHANVVQIYDLRTEGEQFSLILEFVEGMSLGKLLKERGPLPPHIAVTIAADIAAGLDHAHSAGIIHRDLKPDNVMVSNAAEIKITDFGLVTLRDQPALTQDGVLVGTPAYMAPEQVDGSPLTAGTDLFALGLILFEMLTGKRLFERNTMQATLQAVQSFKPVMLDEFGDLIPVSLKPVIERLLDRSPVKRFGSAGEARDALARALPEGLLPRALIEDFLSGKPVRYATTKSVARAKKWSWKLRAVTTAILLLAAAGLVFLFSKVAHKPDEIVGPHVGPFNPDTTVVDTPVVPKGGIGQDVPETDLGGVDRSTVKPADTTSGTRPIDTAPVKSELAGDGFLALASRPWARIYIGDSLVGTTPLPSPLKLPAGKHRILMLNPEIAIPVQTEVEIRQGQTNDLSVNLYDYVGRLRVASVKPWADVFVDGEFALRTPSSKIVFKPLGTYQVVLKHPEFPDYIETVVFRQGDSIHEIRVDLNQR